MWRYFVGLFLTIGLIILLIMLIVGGGDGGQKSKDAKVPLTKKELTSYANTGAEVRFIIDGPVNSVEEHRQAEISVSRNNTRYEQRTGYNGQVLKSYNFPNTQASFSEFLNALANVGFTQGILTAENADESGFCPTGNRYVFELINDSKTLQRFWATSCGNDIGTYKGQLAPTLKLFRAQVPDYVDLNRSTNFKLR